jgi:phosphoribosylformylglycinamidine synthase
MPTSAPTVHRIEVFAAPGHADPIGEAIRRDAAAAGVKLARARATHVYLVQADPKEPLSAAQLDRVRTALLADPVVEDSRVGSSPVGGAGGGKAWQVIEVHPLPGVMDPVAQSVQQAIKELLELRSTPQVSTGWRYDLEGATAEQVKELANRLLANPVIQRVHTEPYHPHAFPAAAAHEGAVRSVKLIGLGDAQLEKLSREAHLFLSLDEMKAVQAEYTRLGRDPREIELETLAQTWSEHCVHKTLKSEVRYRSDGATPPRERRSDGGEGGDPIRWEGRPGHEVQSDGTVIIHNLLKSTVAAATHRLNKEGVDWTLSVFVDNAGVIAFDENTAVNIKVETHNHPSAIEPYGGAATGVGGCIRDVIATGLGARPIANTDVFCVASPDMKEIPTGCLHPRRILTQVVAGVRDYGNRMGIPTVSGAVYFDDRHVGNPLVFCGCIGVMPRERVKGEVQRGDLIVALGGRTGRDGIHGATFSSAELEHTATDEFAHAVQIGNAITEKQTLDAIMRAAGEGGSDGGTTKPLFSAMTDCGAGGFSSAVGELGKTTGATVHLERAPLKYAGLSPTEIWISEAQERFILAVPERNLDALRRICEEESVELAVLGEFAPPQGSTMESPDLQLLFHGREVGRLNMHFMHEGIPTPRREAVWVAGSDGATERRIDGGRRSAGPAAALKALLAHPNIASKHWIIRQYDHEVKGATAIKPLGGPSARGPMDASVIKPVPSSNRGLAISCGLQTGMGDPAIGGDPYLMTIAAIDECVRNLVCVGADPTKTAILDNFCWPSCKKPENLGTLVRAAEGCYDGAMAYRTPFVSGKDSLNNQFTTQDGRTIEIPPTLLITGMGIVADVAKCVTMDAKSAGNTLLLVGPQEPGVVGAMGGSHYQRMFGVSAEHAAVPRTDLVMGPRTAAVVAKLIQTGLILSAHDVSDGGLLAAIAEMLIAGSTTKRPIGAEVSASGTAALFGESPSRYVLEVAPGSVDAVRKSLGDVPHAVVGKLDESGVLRVGGEQSGVEELAKVWLGTLDW